MRIRLERWWQLVLFVCCRGDQLDAMDAASPIFTSDHPKRPIRRRRPSGRFQPWVQVGDTSELEVPRTRTWATLLPVRFLLGTSPRLSHLAAMGLVASLVKCVSSRPVRRAGYFWKNAGPIVVKYKFTQWWVEARNIERKKRDVIYGELHDRYAEPTLRLILHLRGLYVKLGQVASSRPDFLPIPYLERLSTLQDAVPQLPLSEIEAIVRKELQREFGLEWEDVFESMDAITLGSASIGQVHRAVLTKEWVQRTGYRGDRVVACKIMHPDAKSLFRTDFQVFRWLCRVALPDWRDLLNELERRIMTEFDYRREAANMKHVRENMAVSPYRTRVYVPEPLDPLCCKTLLVMEMLKGKKLVDAIQDGLIEALGGDEAKAKQFLEDRKKQLLLGQPTEEQGFALSGNPISVAKLLALRNRYKKYIKLLVEVHGYQIFENGCFNGDPHHGNCLELEDGRLGLIDYGQTKRLSETEKSSLARVVAAIGTGASQREIADAMRSLGFKAQDNDDDAALEDYALIFFDSDIEGRRRGHATPALYFQALMTKNPLVQIPDEAIFVARVSFLFRGLGSGVGSPVRTAVAWRKLAQQNANV